MELTPNVTRRTLLVGAGTLAGAATLAACSSGSDTKKESTPPKSQAAPATGTSGSSSGSGGASPLAKLDDIKVGEAVSAKLDGQDVVVARPTATTAACFSARCTHMGCTVKPNGAKLSCPCHGSQFNAVTGAVLNGPASAPLNKIDVTVANGEVVPAS